MLRNFGICATYVVSSVVALKSVKQSSFVPEKVNTPLPFITQKKKTPTDLLKLFVWYAAACDSKKIVSTENGNSYPTEDATIAIKEKLEHFCTKEKIPHNFFVNIFQKENEQIQEKIHIKLPNTIQLKKLVSKIIEFRSTRQLKQNEPLKTQSSIYWKTLSDSLTCLRTKIYLGDFTSPCIVDFFIEHPNKIANLDNPSPNLSIDVELYRENAQLTDDDIATVKLLLYLGYKTAEDKFLTGMHHPQGNDAFENMMDLKKNKVSNIFTNSFFFETPPKHVFFSRHPACNSFFSNFLINEDQWNRGEDNVMQMDNVFLSSFFDCNNALENEENLSTTSNRNQVCEQEKKQLQNLGLTVFMPENTTNTIDWSVLPGYEEAKRVIDESLLISYSHGDLLNSLAEKTRKTCKEDNRPRVILFKGPPGTGKTTSARIISKSTKLPLIYVPLESILSKWYGESEKNLAKLFDLCNKLGKSYGGCILFIDEVDALASSRDQTTSHEASKRILSILLRRLDGFDTCNDKTLLICATNRENDLDKAFRSRIDVTVPFPIPNEKSRRKIIQRYAQHLTEQDIELVSKESHGLSGRNIRDFCFKTEREWVAKLLEENSEKSLSKENLTAPPVHSYISAAREKVKQQSSIA